MNVKIPFDACRQISTIREFEGRIHKQTLVSCLLKQFSNKDCIRSANFDRHCIVESCNEDNQYIFSDESDEKIVLDALKFYRKRITKGELLTNEELVAIEGEVDALIKDAVASKKHAKTLLNQSRFTYAAWKGVSFMVIKKHQLQKV